MFKHVMLTLFFVISFDHCVITYVLTLETEVKDNLEKKKEL